MKEIEKIHNQYRYQLPKVVTHYDRSANGMVKTYPCYVTKASLENVMSGRYDVTCPSLFNSQLKNVPVSTQGSAATFGGTGDIQALTVGTPMLLTFVEGSSSRPVLTANVDPPRGDLNENQKGQSVNQETSPGVVTSVPLTAECVQAGGACRSKVVPHFNEDGSAHPSGAGSETPGSREVYTYSGQKVSVVLKERVTVDLGNTVSDTKGSKKSLSKNTVYNVLEVIRILKRLQRSKEPADFINAGGRIYKIVVPQNRIVSGDPSRSRQDAVKALGVFEKVIRYFNLAGILSSQQINFIQEHILKNAKALEEVWGIVEQTGKKRVKAQEPPGTGSLEDRFGLPSSEYPTDLELPDLEGAVFNTDELTIPESILQLTPFGDIFGAGNSVAGGAAPLATEGSLILGGSKKKPGVEEVIQNKILPVYRVVDDVLNELDFIRSPVDRLATKLFQIGVKSAGPIVRSVQQFQKTRSITDLLKVAQTIVPVGFQVALAIGQTRLGGSKQRNLENLEQSVTKPNITQCPILPPTVYDAFDAAEEEDDEAINDFFENILYVNPADFSQWVVEPSLLADWLRSHNLSAADAIDTLLEGKLLEFLVQVGSQEAGIDINLLSSDLEELRIYNKQCFNLAPRGAEITYAIG